MINGILWKLRTGAPCRDLPERYGPWKTGHERLRRWTADGTWDRILAHTQVSDELTRPRHQWRPSRPPTAFGDGSVTTVHGIVE